MERDVTKIWHDILNHNKITNEPGKGLKLVNLTTNDIMATGNSPSQLLDEYFWKQVNNANREYFERKF